jgi:endonuclease III
MSARADLIVKELLDRYGYRYVEQAGIRQADRPGPLYQLLVLATLLSARISADIAVTAARELFAAGYRSPKAMSEAGWQDRVDALGRGGYRRYDERTATMLGDGAALLSERWSGDLRRLRDEGGGDSRGIMPLLTEFPGMGPAGAGIFLREAQHVWPSVVPYVDAMMASGARRVGLPGSHESLDRLLCDCGEPARLAAALVRVSLSPRAAAEVTAAVPDLAPASQSRSPPATESFMNLGRASPAADRSSGRGLGDRGCGCGPDGQLPGHSGREALARLGGRGA